MDKILGKLKPLIRVGSGGGLLSEDVVPEFLRIVEEQDALPMTQALSITVLLQTTEPTILRRFLTSGGWGHLEKWLAAARDKSDTATLKKLLQGFLHLPDDDLLFVQGSVLPNVKKIAKSKDSGITAEVKTYAKQLIDRWKRFLLSSVTTLAPDTSASQSAAAAALPTVAAASSKQDKQALARPRSPAEVGAKSRVGKRPRLSSIEKDSPKPSEKRRGSQDDGVPKKAAVSSGAFAAALGVAKRPAKKKPPPRRLSQEQLGQSKPKTTVMPAHIKAETQKVIVLPAGTPMQPESADAQAAQEVQPQAVQSTGPPKRRVHWAVGPALTRIKYYEKDSEQHNHHKSTKQLSQEEHANERSSRAKHISLSELLVRTDFRLLPVDLPGDDAVKPGSDSNERTVQHKREQSVLAEIFPMGQIPPPPSEPAADCREPDPGHEPTTIPLEEEAPAVAEPDDSVKPFFDMDNLLQLQSLLAPKTQPGGASSSTGVATTQSPLYDPVSEASGASSHPAAPGYAAPSSGGVGGGPPFNPGHGPAPGYQEPWGGSSTTTADMGYNGAPPPQHRAQPYPHTHQQPPPSSQHYPAPHQGGGMGVQHSALPPYGNESSAHGPMGRSPKYDDRAAPYNYGQHSRSPPGWIGGNHDRDRRDRDRDHRSHDNRDRHDRGRRGSRDEFAGTNSPRDRERRPGRGLYRTVQCKFQHSQEGCRNGDKCTFLHT
eukprot:m.336498 g.336498  ORF g.336498 m.336498 type:complete len:713 (-) comp19797_c0_seq1:3290-5428(-)